ncbi:MAG: sensor histidine kinase [Microcoleaceae cyanobacterium]
MRASSEFVTLCQAQISLIASLGASFGVVYLAEDWVQGGDRKLIPIVTYPESGPLQPESLRLPPSQLQPPLQVETNSRQLGSILQESIAEETDLISIIPEHEPDREEEEPTVLQLEGVQLAEDVLDPEEIEYEATIDESASTWQAPMQRIVLPLIHETVVIGFLVTGRADRSWNAQEEHQIQTVAHALSMAYGIDHRANWFQSQLERLRHLQTQERRILDSLLHQLKSPLTALKTFGKLLLKRLQPEDRNYSAVEGIVRESDRIQELIQQIDQALERAEIPSLPMAELSDLLDQPIPLLPASDRVEPIVLETVLNPLIASAQVVAADRQLTLATVIPESLPQVRANIKSLREVLSNIVDNALKYTPAGGQIQIQVSVKPFPQKLQNRIVDPDPGKYSASWLGIATSDSGWGIPMEDLEHLFQRGYRGIQADGDIPGTGLGLAIAYDLVHQMGGEIQVVSPVDRDWVSSEFLTILEAATNVRPGTTFIVWLQIEGETPFLGKKRDVI